MKVAGPLIEPTAAWSGKFLADQRADDAGMSFIGIGIGIGSSDRGAAISDGGARPVPPVIGDRHVHSPPSSSTDSTNFDPPILDDADGVSAQIEARGANAGDGNRDGVRDALQADVTSMRVSGGASFVTVEALGYTLKDIRALGAPAASDGQTKLPLGMFAFEVHGVARGGAAEVRLFLPEGTAANSYFKQDSKGILQRFDFDGTTGATFDGNVVTLHLVDGGRGDIDGIANGVIVDPGGPGGGGSGPPIASDDSFTVAHDRPLVVYPAGLLSNDTDPTNLPLTVHIVSQPTSGSIEYNSFELSPTGAGGFQYTPNALFVGTDSFTYKASNGLEDSNTATVTISVVNSQPSGQNDSFMIIEDQRLTVIVPGSIGSAGESGIDDITQFTVGKFTAAPEAGWYGVTTSGGLLGNDTDADGDTLRAVLVSSVSHGKLNLFDDGSFVYTPDPNFVGVDAFTYRVNDGIAETSVITAKIVVNHGSILDMDGRDATTGERWMTEGEEQAYGLGVSTVSAGDVLARDPRAPTAALGWALTERKVFFDNKTLSVGGSTTGIIDLLGYSGDATLSVTALRDIAAGSQTALSSIDYVSTWTHPTLLGVASFITVPVGPKVVWEKIEITSDHGVLRDNTKDPLTIKDSPRYPDVEVDVAAGRVSPFSQSVNTQLKHRLTYSTAGIPANATLAGKVAEATNAAGFPWLAADFALQSKVMSQTVPVPLGTIPSNEIGHFSIKLKYKAVLTLADATTQNLSPTDVKYSVFITYGEPRNPGNLDELKPTYVRMRIASPILNKAYAEAVTRRAAINPPQTGIPKAEQIVYETLKQHVFAVENGISYDYADEPAYLWRVPHFWTNPYPRRTVQLAFYKKGGDCITGAIFTKFACYVFGVSGTIVSRDFTSKSRPEPTKAVEFNTIRTEEYRNTPKKHADGTLRVLALWDGGDHINKFEGTVEWTDGTLTYYFPSGTQENWVFTNADHVLSIFTFGFGKLVSDANAPSGQRWEKMPDLLDENNNNNVIEKRQWKTYLDPKPASVNLYQ